jgi:predicted DNA-binding protein (MmcQ/YjbR family)
MALSFPETTEAPHFERTSFRVKKKIFATLHEQKKVATLKFSVINQSVYCKVDKDAVYPVPNKWGAGGWTFIALDKVPPKLMAEALQKAYEEVTKQKKKKNPFSR